MAPKGPLRGPGSEGSKGSKGSEGVVSPSAMSMKSALRDWLLCHWCCMTKCKSPLSQEGGVAP